MKTIAIPEGMETELFVMERGALKSVPEMFAKCFPGKRPWIIADTNTWRVAGERLFALLKEKGLDPCEPKIYPGKPLLHPNNSYCEEIAKLLPGNAIPVAVGSGVINDLAKRGSCVAGVRYCCVATACSVDGYTSYGAALSVDGFKKTLPCPAPLAIAADIDILETAPSQMFASGYADLFAKIPAGADWIIADMLGCEKISAPVWDLVQTHLKEWVSDPENMGNVFHGLAATGYAMQLYRDSRPASGAEHLCSHIWEMEKLAKDGIEISHGFKVSVGTVISAKLHEYIIHLPVEEARKRAARPLTGTQREAEIRELLKRGCYGTGIEEVAMAKFLEGKAILDRREQIFSIWEELKKRTAKQICSPEKTLAMLKQAHAPVTLEEVGLTKEQCIHAIRTAQLIRKRYTILDFLYEAGLLEDAIRTLPV